MKLIIEVLTNLSTRELITAFVGGAALFVLTFVVLGG